MVREEINDWLVVGWGGGERGRSVGAPPCFYAKPKERFLSSQASLRLLSSTVGDPWATI